jgi:hypothetical protein
MNVVVVETTPLVARRPRDSSSRGVWVLGASLASFLAALTLTRFDDVASLLSGGDRIRVKFSVDVGCVPLHVMKESPIEDFFEHDVAGVTLQLKGAPPREFGGVNHAARHGHKLTRSGFSTVYSGVFTVPRRAEYGFRVAQREGTNDFRTGIQPAVSAQGKFG